MERKRGNQYGKDWQKHVADMRLLFLNNPDKPFSAKTIMEVLGFTRDGSIISDYVKKLRDAGLNIQRSNKRGNSGYYLAEGSPPNLSPDDNFRLKVEAGVITISRKKPGSSELTKLSATHDEWRGVIQPIIAATGFDPLALVPRLEKIESLLVELSGKVYINSEVAPIPDSVPGNKPGTTKSRGAIPEDKKLLIAAIRTAATSSVPFTKTGPSGVYARSDELPEQFRIGRNRLERVVAELIASGKIIQNLSGTLAVPDSVPGKKPGTDQ